MSLDELDASSDDGLVESFRCHPIKVFSGLFFVRSSSKYVPTNPVAPVTKTLLNWPLAYPRFPYCFL